MDEIRWAPHMNIGVREIDAAHQNIYAIVHRLQKFKSVKNKKDIITTLELLTNYTSAHFDHEIALLKLTNYPELAKHKAEHDVLKQTIQNFYAEYITQSRLLLDNEIEYLWNWFINHTMFSDSLFSAHLRAYGIDAFCQSCGALEPY
jgi:hemerythrin